MSAATQVVLLPAARDQTGLVELFGAERTERIGGRLLARATEWAIRSFGADSVVATTSTPRPGGELIASALAQADPGATLVVVVPELAVWPDELADAIRDDRAASCPLSLGPVVDGGFYLVALTGAHPALTGLPPEAWSGRHALNAIFEAAAGEQLEVGMLQTERALRRAEDVRAVLVDPLTDEELRELLQ